nr:SemiSWEET family transporter [Levilactobacillus brevis]
MGHPVSPLQPFTAAICAFAWVEYGWHRAHKDWPIIISNIPGVVLGIITVVTVYIH